MKFALAYDTKMGDGAIDHIITALDTSGVTRLGFPVFTRKTMLSTIEFEYDLEDGMNLQDWMDGLVAKIEEFAHVRLYKICGESGKERTDLNDEFKTKVKSLANQGRINANQHIQDS